MFTVPNMKKALKASGGFPEVHPGRACGDDDSKCDRTLKVLHPTYSVAWAIDMVCEFYQKNRALSRFF